MACTRRCPIYQLLAVTFLAAAAPPALSGQGTVVDAGELTVRRGTAVIAREEFSVLQTRAANGALGLRVVATAFYPARRTRVTISPQVDLGIDSLPRTFMFEPTERDGTRVLAEFGARRLTVRTLSPQRETAREFRSHPRTLAVDDSVFALYAVLPGLTPGPVRLFTPRTEQHTDFDLTDLGLQAATVNDQGVRLRHFTLTAGGDVRHLWYAETGGLMKIEIPGRQLVVERTSTSR